MSTPAMHLPAVAAQPARDTAAAAARLSFPAIDVLRAAAALLVLVYHVIEHGRWTSFPVSGPLLAVRVGWMGVDLFFVISGFVIGLSALQGHARDGLAFRRPFARRRIARIVPLYALTALVFLLLVDPTLLGEPLRVLGRHLVAHALFLHNLSPTTHGSIDGPNWSVALEMQFYALMLALTPWLARTRVPVMLAILVGVSWAWRAAVALRIGPGLEQATALFVYTSQLPGVLDAFAVGIALAMMRVRAGSARGWASRLLQPSWRGFAAWTVAFALVHALAMALYWPRANYWDHGAMIVGWRTLLAASFGCLVAAAICLPAQELRLLRPLRYLGEISYGIYLWHLPVLLTMIAVPGLAGVDLMWRVLAGTIALAAFSWHFFERPLLRRAAA